MIKYKILRVDPEYNTVDVEWTFENKTKLKRSLHIKDTDVSGSNNVLDLPKSVFKEVKWKHPENPERLVQEPNINTYISGDGMHIWQKGKYKGTAKALPAEIKVSEI